MQKRQSGFGTVEAIAIVIVIVIIGAVGYMLLAKKENSPTAKNNTGESAAITGEIVRIIDREGSCKTYELTGNRFIAVTCPDMGEYKGFSGNYDDSLKEGDRVEAKAILKTAATSERATYHLDTDDAYLKRVEN